MEMQELTIFQQPEEIIQPFAISCVGEVVVVCAKEHTLVLRLRYRHVVEDGAICYELSRIKCSNARPTGALVAREDTLYNASNVEQRKKIMLDQTFFPNIAKVYICNVQSWISPVGIFKNNAHDHLIANLTNMGQLTIYRLEERWQTGWNTYLDISDTWQSHIYDQHQIDTFEELQIMVDEMTITCFSWESVIYQHTVRFAFGTKSGKIALCHLEPNCPKIDHVHQEEEAARIIRYVAVQGQRHFLLVGLESGRLGVYRFGEDTNSRQIAYCAEYVATYLEEDISISALECEVERKANGEELLLILVVKGTYLLALEAAFDGTLLGSVTLNMENFMVTGLQQVCERSYIVTTMPGKIFHIYVNGSRSRTGMQIAVQEVKTDLNVASYALYGVAASRTRSGWFFLGYPSRRFDHLTLRTPTCISFCRFNQQDALKILLQNNTHKLDNYHDAVEMVRFHGNKNFDTLKPLEDLVLVLSLDEQSMYQLKLQLIQLSAKISYQTKRSKAITENLHIQHQYICRLIEVINACRVVYWLADLFTNRTVLDPLQQSALRCLRNFIRSIAHEQCMGDFGYLLANLQPVLHEVLENTDNIHTPDIMHEVCSFCDAPIPADSLCCPEKHQVFRCVLTKIQITLESNEVTCDMCQRYSMQSELLDTIFEHDTAIVDYHKCCICDAPFKEIQNV
uniref:Transcription factor IIIC 90kDa subunit N-terminal domain-containing protein n=1 Tax=Anopheles culicifacies TaxID=139723 RepID=A0A182MDC2_9DIPT